MRLIEQFIEEIPQEKGIEGVYKIIERAGRLCYASDPVEGKAKDFVDRMIKLGHGAMLEHGTIYLKIHQSGGYFPEAYSFDENHYYKYSELYDKYNDNPYTHINECSGCTWAITTNLRVLVENDWLEDLKYLCEPTEYHEKRVSYYINCNRVTSQSLMRHRVFSFAQQSTRYCNFSKDKFGSNITYIRPSWISLPTGTWNVDDRDLRLMYNDTYFPLPNNKDKAFIWQCITNEMAYFECVNELDLKPEEARDILNFSLAAPFIMTGFEEDWKHVLDLRIYNKTGKAHPDVQALLQPMKDRF